MKQTAIRELEWPSGNPNLPLVRRTSRAKCPSIRGRAPTPHSAEVGALVRQQNCSRANEECDDVSRSRVHFLSSGIIGLGTGPACGRPKPGLLEFSGDTLPTVAV